MPQHTAFRKKASEGDQNDPLASFRAAFVGEDENLIYLDGNSLGRMPLASSKHMRMVVETQWGKKLIQSWNDHWINLNERLSEKIAHIIGANPDEVFLGDSTSVNFYKLAFAALKQQTDRTGILTDSLNFPSDLYLIQGMINSSFPQHKLNVIESMDGISIGYEQIEKALNDNTALLTLSHVAYRSAFMYDMTRVNEMAHSQGALVLWDLSHSAGAVALKLHEASADMAVGCTYKYLNGGPGAPAFLYVRRDLQEKLRNPVWGWFGHNKPFDFDPTYMKGDGIKSFGAGTPPILSMAALEPSLTISSEAGMQAIRQKSMLMSNFFLEMTREILLPLGFKVASPAEAERRGSHISLKHPEGYRICKSLIQPEGQQKSIVPDFRPPDNIRLGFAPLYNTFTEVYETVMRLRDIAVSREFERHDSSRSTVT